MIIKEKSLIVALVSGLIICGVLVLTLVGYLAYLELKDKELKSSYQQLLQKVNVKLYSRHVAITGLVATIESAGSLKGRPVLEGRITNNGFRDISDILIMIRFLDKDGAVLYEVVFHPQEPSLGSSSLTQVTLPYLSAPKSPIKTGSSLPFKKILTNCPGGIISELKKPGASVKGPGKWPGSLDVEILSISL